MPTLKEIRIKYYLSRKKLGDLADVSESTIVRIEAGDHRTTKDVVEKVLKALSEKTGEQFTLQNVEGLSIYNVMTDRRQTPRGSKKLGEEAA